VDGARPGPSGAPDPGSRQDLPRRIVGKGECYAPSADELAAFARLPDYALLAARNHLHFGDEAANGAERYLKDAREAGTEPFVKESRLAFALHLLMDRHAAGHIRTPRRRLSNGEARRRHDYDNAMGLVVVTREEAVPLVWQDFGDDCLLGPPGEASLDMVTRASTRAIRHAIDGAPFVVSLPQPNDRNPAVPESPALLTLSIEPLAGATARWRAAGRSVAPAAGGRGTLDFNLEQIWQPPQVTAMILLDGRGGQLGAVAVDPVDTAVLAWGYLRTLRAGPEEKVEAMRYRHPLDRVAVGNWRFLDLKAGLAFSRAASEATGRLGVFAGYSLLYTPYDRVFVRAGVEGIWTGARRWDATAFASMGFQVM
jgi:hypothetical protein